MQNRILLALADARNTKVLLTILWASCDVIVFLQACKEKVGPQALDNGLTCVTNYWLRISCVMNTTVQPLSKAPPHSLEFQHCYEDWKFGCQLENAGGLLRCSCEAKMEDRISLMSFDHFKVTLHFKRSGSESRMSLNSTFQAECNVKPDAPSNLTVVRNPSGYLLTWITNYERHPYGPFRNKLLYKLSYHRARFPDEVFTVHPLGKTQHIDDIDLETDTEYTAVVSSHPSAKYGGQWSEWSPPVHWRTKPAVLPVTNLEVSGSLWNIVLPVCIIASIMLCFFFSPAVRLKIKVWSVIPTPVPYFQPLFNSHKGNFRSWLLSQGSPEEPLRPEEVQKLDEVREEARKTDAVTGPSREDEPRPTPPESLSAPCPTPYVAPGNEGWCADEPAPRPASGGRPDTPLSLSLLEVSLAEIFGSRSVGLVLAGEDDWDSETPGPELDSCWPWDAPTDPPKGPSACQDYCTLSGPHNELVPGAALRPDPTADRDSHDVPGPRADIDNV